MATFPPISFHEPLDCLANLCTWMPDFCCKFIFCLLFFFSVHLSIAFFHFALFPLYNLPVKRHLFFFSLRVANVRPIFLLCSYVRFIDVRTIQYYLHLPKALLFPNSPFRPLFHSLRFFCSSHVFYFVLQIGGKRERKRVVRFTFNRKLGSRFFSRTRKVKKNRREEEQRTHTRIETDASMNKIVHPIDKYFVHREWKFISM